MRLETTLRRIAPLAAVATILGSPAYAANNFDPGTPEITASYETIGFIIPYSGDDNSNASVSVEFKPSSSSNWVPIHRAARTPSRSSGGGPGPGFAGRAFWLSENKLYDLRFTYSDPDGVVGSNTVTVSNIRTRLSPVPVANGGTYYIATNGSDSNPGTFSQPWASFAHAVSEVQPGDTVKVRGGVYHEVEFELNNSLGGSEGFWTVFEPYQNETPIIDGSDPVFQQINQGNWTPHPNQSSYPDVWYADISSHQNEASYTPRVSWGSDQQWLPPYFEDEECDNDQNCDLDDLVNDFSGLGMGGWHLDADGSEGLGGHTIFVTLPDGTDPNTVPLYIGRTSFLFLIDDSDYVAIRGMTIRHAYHCLTSWNSQYLLIEDNTVHNCVYPIELRHPETKFITVQDNEVFDVGMVEDPKQGEGAPLWEWVKHHTEVERQGLKVVDAGNGNVFRRNYVHDVFNGSIFEDHDDKPLKNLEVYNNIFANIGDDGMEPEGELINSAIWGNRIEDALAGMSGAPINVGPLFIMYNEVVDHWIRSLKFNHGYGSSEGHGEWFVYHNTLMSTVVVAPFPEEGWDDGDGLRVPGFDGGMRATFRNNIFQGTDRAIDDTQSAGEIDGKDRDLDFDNLWTVPHHDPSRFVKWENEGWSSFAEFQAGSCTEPSYGNGCQEANGLSVDPLYLDGDPSTPPEDKDLRLTETSPLIDRGVVIPGINDFGPFAFTGSAPDIGANEAGPSAFADGFETGDTSLWSQVVP